MPISCRTVKNGVGMTSGQHWVDAGWYLNPRSAPELFADIGSIGGYSSRASIAWRGMSSIDYSLISSMQRIPGMENEGALRDSEVGLLDAARQWGLGYGLGGWASDLQLLADLQHYGTGTRLMDVTSNPMTALWFACQSPKQLDIGPAVSKSGVLLAINTAGWKRFGRGQPAGTYEAIDNPSGWELQSALTGEDPFVVESLLPNDRLRAQEGFFIAGRVPSIQDQGGPFKSIAMRYEQIDPGVVRARIQRVSSHTTSWDGPLPYIAVKINSGLKVKVLQRLENSYNRHPSVLFPDFDGFRSFSVDAEPREKLPSAQPGPSFL